MLEWGQHHARYVEMWEQRLGSRETDMTLADMRNYKETHLKWYDNGVGERCRKLKNFLQFHQDPSMSSSKQRVFRLHLHTFVDHEQKRSLERG